MNHIKSSNNALYKHKHSDEFSCRLKPDTMLKAKAIKAAIKAYADGSTDKADLICHELLDMGYYDPIIFALLSLIAYDIKEIELAKEYLLKSLKATSFNPVDNDLLLFFQNQMSKIHEKTNNECDFQPPVYKNRSNRFLLIKAWGFGFWADVDHVLGQFLLAEMTGRIPIVHWGENSLYKPKEIDNAFELYFEQPNKYSIHDLINKNHTFYPPKWKDENLLSEGIDKWSGPFSATPAISYLNRPEDVAVSDFHTSINDLVPWLRQDHPLYHMDRENIYRHLINKYLKLKPVILNKIEKYYTERLSTKKPILAVHMRGGHKWEEDPNFNKISDSYHEMITKHLLQFPETSIFLLTNDDRVKSCFINKYNDRIITTNCTRTVDDVDAHYCVHHDRYNLGREVIIDTMLATKCDHFIGYGWSKLSCMVHHLKSWSPGTCVLLGNDINSDRLFYDKTMKLFVPMEIFMEAL